MEDSNKQNMKKDDDCPLCKVSEDTLQRLKNADKANKEEKKDKGGAFEENSSNEPSKKSKKSFFIYIAIVLLIVFVFLLFFQGPNGTSSLLEKENQGQQNQDTVSVGVRAGDLALDFSSEDVYGNKIVLSDIYKEKPVLLIFWATWCSFCAKELPDLKIFVEKYENEVQVIAIPSSEMKKAVKKYIEAKEINFLMALDETRNIWNDYFVRGTPSHFLIDKQGKIITLRPGLASYNDLEVMMKMLK